MPRKKGRATEILRKKDLPARFKACPPKIVEIPQTGNMDPLGTVPEHGDQSGSSGLGAFDSHEEGAGGTAAFASHRELAIASKAQLMMTRGCDPMGRCKKPSMAAATIAGSKATKLCSPGTCLPSPIRFNRSSIGFGPMELCSPPGVEIFGTSGPDFSHNGGGVWAAMAKGPPHRLVRPGQF